MKKELTPNQKRIITSIGIEIYNFDKDNYFLCKLLKAIQEVLASKINNE